MHLLLATPPKRAATGLADVKSISMAVASGQYGTATHIPSATTALSAQGWFKGTTAGNAVFIGVPDGSGNREWYVGLAVDPAGACLLNISSDGAAGYGTAGSVVLTDGAWHHWAVTWDAATHTSKIYIDGVLDVSDSGAPSSIFSGSTAFCLGCYTLGGSPAPFLNGGLDWVSLYHNYVLTQSDITALYGGGHPPANMSSLASFTHATAWWPIGEGSDTSSTLFDNTANGHDITLAGSPSLITDHA